MMDEDGSETLESRHGIWKALARRTQSALNSDVVPCRRDQIRSSLKSLRIIPSCLVSSWILRLEAICHVHQ